MTLKPLRERVELLTLLRFAAAAVACILPFALYRLWVGEYLVAVLDLLLVVAIGGAGLYAWSTGRRGGASLLVTASIVVGCVLVTTVAGRAGLVWAYPILLVNFFLIDRRLALAGNAGLIVGVLLVDAAFGSLLERFSFLASAVLTTVLAFLFAQRTDRQHARLEALASHDPLTQAGNRRLMEQELAAAVATARGRNVTPALAVVDLDHFKQVNDRFGHDAGDRVLVAFAGLLREGVRKTDRLFRFGGEEFVLLLPSTDRDGLTRALDKLLALTRARLTGPEGPVTASFGAALWRFGEPWTEWLGRADAALYRAKRGGRDRVVIDGLGDDDGTEAERRGASAG